MTPEELKNIQSESLGTLYELSTNNSSSPEGHAARAELEKRRLKPMVDAARESARAARWAAGAALASAIAAILALFFK